MEVITKNPGLQHISEDIFKLLDNKSLMNCQATNSSWKNILEQSIFWLKKMKMEGWQTFAKHIENQQIAKDFVKDFLDFEDLPPDVESKWRALLKELANFYHEPKEFVMILIKIYNNQAKLLPLEVVRHLMEANKYTDFVESMLEHENPSTKFSFLFTKSIWFSGSINPTKFAVDLENVTSIHLAAWYGFTRVVEKLCKKYKDPLVKDTAYGINPIHLAAINGHYKIVKYLISFTDTPLAPDNFGWTPIHYAILNDTLDTIKFLVGLTDTPNAPINARWTPIEIAQSLRNVKLQKFLEDYCEKKIR